MFSRSRAETMTQIRRVVQIASLTVRKSSGRKKNKRIKDKAAHACHALCRARVLCDYSPSVSLRDLLGIIIQTAKPKREILRETSNRVHVGQHDLRRSFITVAESREISVVALKMLVNHSVGNDVTSGYIILSTARLREAAQTVADRLKELCGSVGPEGVSKPRTEQKKV